MVSSVLSARVTRRDRPSAPFLSPEGGRTVLWLDGEHDISTRFAVSDSLEAAFSANDADVIVDLSGVTFVGAATIDEFVRGRNTLRGQCRNLTLRSPSRTARRLLDVMGLTNLVEPNESFPELMEVDQEGGGVVAQHAVVVENAVG
jgi:anti-anti-sigma factor